MYVSSEGLFFYSFPFFSSSLPRLFFLLPSSFLFVLFSHSILLPSSPYPLDISLLISSSYSHLLYHHPYYLHNLLLLLLSLIPTTFFLHCQPTGRTHSSTTTHTRQPGRQLAKTAPYKNNPKGATMSMKRFSSLHTLFFLAALVILWLGWSNIRLQGSNYSSRRQGLRDNGVTKGTIDEKYINHGPIGSEHDLPLVSDRTTSPLETLRKPYTIVTAASSNHFCALESFLYSLSEVLDGLERTELRPTIVVYNLGGMTPQQMEQMEWLKDNQYMDEYKDFDYSAYPDFWDIKVARGEYGWKSGIIQEVADKYRGLILWLDSGNMLALDFLRYLPGYLDMYGFWSPQSSGTFQQYTHAGLPQFYGDSVENYLQESNCNGAAVAFDASNDKIYYGLLKEWYRCSSTKECIAPAGSSRSNHRQDQAALTYLVKKMNFKEQCRHFPEHYGVTVHQDKVCKERIRAYKIMKGMDQELQPLDGDLEEEEEDD